MDENLCVHGQHVKQQCPDGQNLIVTLLQEQTKREAFKRVETRVAAYTPLTAEEGRTLYAGYVRAQEEITALRGVLGLTQDEYVKQVGTWKIIQRLEAELKEAKEVLTGLGKKLEEISTLTVTEEKLQRKRGVFRDWKDIAREALTLLKRIP